MLPHNILILLKASVLVLACAAPARASLELKASLGSAYTLPGEASELWLMVDSDTRPETRPAIPEAEHLTFKFLGEPIMPSTTSERKYIYRFSVESYREGTHVIPPFTIRLKGVTMQSPPLQLHVSSLPDDAWFEHEIRGEKVQIASRVCLPDRTRFEGETTPAEVKVYLPAHFKIDKGSIADLAHDGVAAERFNISSRIHPSNIVVTTTRINQQDYAGVTYRSAVTPLHDGEVSIGPGQARLTVETRISTRGFTDAVLEPLELPVGKRTFKARPLPQPAPEGFRNAVGRFTLSAQADTRTLREEDPISLRLTVTGTGNLDTLASPELTASPAEWKSYPAHRLPRKGPRHTASGVAVFTQVIRPNGLRDVIPSYRLVSFDPEREQYITLTTPPIPFDLAPTKGTFTAGGTALPDLSTPVEEMEGILGLVDPLRDTATGHSRLSHAWHLLPALLAFFLFVRIVRQRFLPRFARPPRAEKLEQALADLQRTGDDSRKFLRATGTFVETWIPDEYRDDKTRELLARRDQNCYQPDGIGTKKVTSEDQRVILAHLRQRALELLSLILILTALTPGVTNARDDATTPGHHYEEARAAWDNNAFRIAIDHYYKSHPDDTLPADVLYNIGNCYFHLGERGLATLYYRRALHLEPGHPEARQNLSFLKRKTGAITFDRPVYQERIASLSRSLYLNVTLAGAWITLLITLAIMTVNGKRRRLWTGFAAGLLLAFTGSMALLLYPSDIEFAPVGERATMINNAPVLAGTEATTIKEEDDSPRGSRKVIEVPPGSLCRPLATRGPWTYIELANNIRGWVPSAYVRRILPVGSDRPDAPRPDA